MPKYTIRFHKPTHDYADVEVEAENPKAAMQLAIDGDEATIPDPDDWEPCDDFGDEVIAYVLDEGDNLHFQDDLFPEGKEPPPLVLNPKEMTAVQIGLLKWKTMLLSLSDSAMARFLASLELPADGLLTVREIDALIARLSEQEHYNELE